MRVRRDGGFGRVPDEASVASNRTLARTPTLQVALADRSVGELRQLFGGLSVSRIARLPRAQWAPVLAGYLGRHVGPERTPAAAWAVIQGASSVARDVAIKPPAELLAQVGAMHGAWPRDHEGPADPAPFLGAAAELEAYRESRRVALGDHPAPDHLRALLREADAIHGKAAQTENVVAAALDFFDRQRDALAGLDGWTDDDARLPLLAAPWLNLADLETPVAVLAAHRKLTDDEFVAHVKPRFANNAALLERYGLAGEDVVAFMANVRGRERPLGAAALDLLEGAVAMGAKPFFRDERGVDIEKLAGALRGNAERAQVPEALTEVVLDWVRTGGVDRAVQAARRDNLYVRR
ncbi:MAG: hypothetical protein RMA76_34440 [Deltaproteobacteria bacterium]|jgi:hypothetical protein